MDSINVECVWYQSKRDFNRFVRSIEDPKTTVIDYSIIKNKLIKADPMGDEPTPAIIGLNIISSVKNAVSLERKAMYTTIVYSFKNLNEDTVVNFIGMVRSKTDRDLTFTLNVLNMSKVPSKDILSKFDSVKFIDND
jgi:hypothetical protein